MEKEIHAIHQTESSDSDLAAVINIVNALKPDKNIIVTPQSPLIEEVGIDSLMLMDIIEHVQKTCRVYFDPQDYSYESFVTVEAIVELIRKHRSSIGRTPLSPSGDSPDSSSPSF